MNYVLTHCHTDFSNGTTNIDSVTKFGDYIKKAVELNMKAIAFTEHGNIFSWVQKKTECEKNNIKYIHSVEAYVTETLETKTRDNYHMCLYAKNYEGVIELNQLITNSYNREDGHFYYVPRMTFNEILNTSENIIITTACLGGILNKGTKELKEKFLKFLKKNNDRCFLEIQHHQDETQKRYNLLLEKLSRKYDIRLIAGTDTHALNKTHEDGRKILQRAKGVFFEGEDNWDINFKTYDELIKAYEKQGVLEKSVFVDAINNTNVLADMIESFELNKEYKYPKMYKNPNKTLVDKIKKGIKEKGVHLYPNYKTEYVPRIKYELEVYNHNKAVDFLLLDEDIKTAMKKEDNFCGYSRGSVSGSIIAYLIGMTDVDSIKHKLSFERFMNKERVSLADVDTDWSPSQRDRVKEYIYDKKDLYCADIITFNTVAEKGSIRDCARALQIPLEEVNEICENIETKKSYYKEKYPELFKYADIVNGTIVSIGTHPCGIVVSPIPLNENMGLLTLTTCEYPVTMLNMKEIDSLNYTKLDVLGLDNIEIINKTCKLAGIERLTPDNVPDDENVWLSIRDNTLGIFQWEGTGSFYIKELFSNDTINKIKQINPNFKYIDLFSVGNGAIRPAGESYRNKLSKGIFQDNGHPALNELLSPTLGYLVYQEQIIEFLYKFCGYTMGEADIVRRGFAKKTGTEQHIPKIKEGFIKTMKTKYDVNEKESEKLIVNFLKVIEDASSYLFSLNHSNPYSYIGYICGYLRYYYPLEFLTVMLNINSDKLEKTSKIYEYAKENNIKILPPKFGYSKADYFYDKNTKAIYKGLGSIKFLNKNIADDLYELSKIKDFKTFTDLLVHIKTNISLNSKQMNILIKLGYFEQFGKAKKLLNCVEFFEKVYSKKTFDKETFSMYKNEFKQSAKTETAKLWKDVDKIKLINLVEEKMPNENISISEKIKAEIDFIGTPNTINKNANELYFAVTDTQNHYYLTMNLYRLKDGRTIEVRGENKPVKVGDIIKINSTTRKERKKLVDNKWVGTGIFYTYVTFDVINKK